MATNSSPQHVLYASMLGCVRVNMYILKLGKWDLKLSFAHDLKSKNIFFCTKARVDSLQLFPSKIRLF